MDWKPSGPCLCDALFFGSDTDRSIKVELEKHNCRYIGSFTQALDFIQSSLKIG